MARELAHQLGTPISSLQGWVQVLELPLGERPGDMREAEIASAIEEDLVRLERVSRRFELIGREPELKSVSLVRVVSELRGYLEARPPRLGPGVALHVDVPKTCPGYRDMRSPGLGTRERREERSGRGGRYRGFDHHLRPPFRRKVGHPEDQGHGPGVSQEIRDRLFDPGITTKSGGWGVGLTLTRRIIEGSTGPDRVTGPLGKRCYVPSSSAPCYGKLTSNVPRRAPSALHSQRRFLGSASCESSAFSGPYRLWVSQRRAATSRGSLRRTLPRLGRSGVWEDPRTDNPGLPAHSRARCGPGAHHGGDLHQQGRRRNAERIEGTLGRSPKGMWMGTFHALGARLLRRHAPQLGWSRTFTIYDAEAGSSQVKRSTVDVGLDPKRWSPKAMRSKSRTRKTAGHCGGVRGRPRRWIRSLPEERGPCLPPISERVEGPKRDGLR